MSIYDGVLGMASERGGQIAVFVRLLGLGDHTSYMERVYIALRSAKILFSKFTHESHPLLLPDQTTVVRRSWFWVMHRHSLNILTVVCTFSSRNAEYCEDIQVTVAAIGYSRPITEWLVHYIPKPAPSYASTCQGLYIDTASHPASFTLHLYTLSLEL